MLSTTATSVPVAAVSTITPAWGWWGNPGPGNPGGPGGGSTSGGGTTGGTSGGTTTTITNPTPPSGAYTPAELEKAYGFSALTDTGTGETIAIVDAYNDPNIQSDLATFDAYYKLPTASLTVENQSGSTTSLAANNASWDLEIALDVEMAHAAAPGRRSSSSRPTRPARPT